MKYHVEIDGTKFIFESSEEAMIFAETAKKACVSKRYNGDPVRVYITIVADGEKEDE